jgi:hypothetical protein
MGMGVICCGSNGSNAMRGLVVLLLQLLQAMAALVTLILTGGWMTCLEGQQHHSAGLVGW